jgi:hypothetical protein
MQAIIGQRIAGFTLKSCLPYLYNAPVLILPFKEAIIESNKKTSKQNSSSLTKWK